MELRRRLAGAALALRAGDDRRSRPVHRELGPYGDRLEPLPRVGPVRARTLVLRPCKGGLTPGLAAIALPWLVFLPDAPYLVTGLKFVGYRNRVPVLFRVLLLSA